MPWRKKWQPTPVFLPGKSHGWRSLAGYSPWGHKESDTTERLHFREIKHLKTVIRYSWTLVCTICLHLRLCLAKKNQIHYLKWVIRYNFYSEFLTDAKMMLITFFWCLVAKSCLTLLWSHDYSLPGSSVHGISQARILDWVVISFLRESLLASGFFYLLLVLCSRLNDTWREIRC